MKPNPLFREYRCCVIIPTYNNEKTLGAVVRDVLGYTDQVMVVNDGSTDSTSDVLKSFESQITILNHEVNLGKGMALRNSFDLAREMGFHHAITIDSDGQHFPADLPLFLEEIRTHPASLIIGARNMDQAGIPKKSSFGHKFSNFWCWVETGVKLTDTQSGYRLYPIAQMANIRCFTTRFEYEVEVVVKASWKGIALRNIPIGIHYEQGPDRVTHFRPFRDFTRVSLINTWLVILALGYHTPRRAIKSMTRERMRSFIQTHFFNESETAARKATSIGFGVFMGIFPVWGYQMLLGVVVAQFFNLNKALVLLAANISFPPFIPFIIYGSYQFGALLVPEPRNDFNFHNEITLDLVKDNFLQYMIGAVALALVAGLLSGGIAFVVTRTYRRFHTNFSDGND